MKAIISLITALSIGGLFGWTLDKAFPTPIGAPPEHPPTVDMGKVEPVIEIFDVGTKIIWEHETADITVTMLTAAKDWKSPLDAGFECHHEGKTYRTEWKEYTKP